MTCEVIRDLLPLCADGVASQESRAAVEEHIRTCDECRALYETMCAPVEAQETAKEPDYMAAVRQQKKENRRFILRVYGIALGLALLFGVMWLIDQMMRYESWRYEGVPISYETVKKEMPQVLLTREEKDLAKVIFSLPEVQKAFQEGSASAAGVYLPEALYLELLTRSGVDPDSVKRGYADILGRAVILDYYNDEYRYSLEFFDSDESGHADLLRKMACKTGEDVKTLYYAEINAALIVEGKTGDAERDALEAEYEEEFTTTYEKVSGKRLWLDFLKKN